MSTSNPQDPSPSRFIYASRDSSTTVVLDCITVAAGSYDFDEDDDDIRAGVCEIQTVTGQVVFSNINWRPTPRSLSPQGPRIVELPDSESSEAEEEGARTPRGQKAGSLSPLSMPPRLLASHSLHQQQQRTSSRTPETSYPPNLMAYSTTAPATHTEDNEDHYPERLALSPGGPAACPVGVDSPPSPQRSATPSSSSTVSFCTCEPEPDQADIISEIRQICLTATQKFIGGYISKQRKRRRRRQREKAMRGERAMAKERERERGRVSHSDKVKKTSSGRSISQGSHTHQSSPNVRKATVHSDTETEGYNDSPTDSDSTLSHLSPTNPRNRTPTPVRRRPPISSRKPTSPFSYSWMSSQMSPTPNLSTTKYDTIPNNDSDLDLDTATTSSSSSSSGDSSLRLALQSHRLPFHPPSPQIFCPPITSSSSAKLTKNITRICSILWQRSSLTPLEQKRDVLQTMALVLDLGAALALPDPSSDDCETTTTTTTTATVEDHHQSLEEIADAGVLLCEVLEDWDAVDRIETLEGKYWDYFGGLAG
ncbi:hypothetical protein QBC40DRAFT_349726 [Triangularia verruculosa]|uniref:Uncharacterized protein n=1 Tax=Triangularia verruculosa TaxID=2587418 RepID=A0AAN7AUJ3_9PEZI|nr:hypothetical protein QBC40DRAFT_349726 [Triangularia verruculosa]